MRKVNQKPKLVLITDEFPYSHKEASFLASELGALAERFAVTLISKSASHVQVLPVDAGIRVLHYDRPHAIAHLPFFFALPFDADFHAELVRIRAEGAKKPFLNALLSGYFIIEARFFQHFLRKNGFAGKGCDIDLFYSYWNNYAAYALTRLRARGFLPGAKIITRTHGYDLYSERQPFGRQPMKQQTDRGIDRVYFISRQGQTYYKAHFATDGSADKYRLAYLGSKDFGLAPVPEGGKLSILTLSSTAPVKRLPLLIEALAKIADIPVSWTHFGGGPELEKLRTFAAQKLAARPNISFSFPGALEHAPLMERLKASAFDCIVNVSKSEGLPVSILEAASLGVPAIATNVGGTREALPDGTPLLLPADVTAEGIAEALTTFYALPADERRSLRQAARARWEEAFDAANNSRAFSDELRSFVNDPPMEN